MRCDGAARTYGARRGRHRRAAADRLRGLRRRARSRSSGPSGSGKSTLLHLLAGLDEPTVGTVTLAGDRRPRALRPGPVAVVFQGPSLLPPLTVARERRPAARARRLPRRRGARSARAPRSSGSDLARAGATSCPRRSPAARRSASRSPARWPASRGSILADEPTGQLDRASGAAGRRRPARRRRARRRRARRRHPRPDRRRAPRASAGRCTAAAWPRPRGSRHGRADLAARPARPPPRRACSRPPPASPSPSRCSPRSAPSSPSTTSKMTERAIAPRARRLAGRGAAGREPAQRARAGAARTPASTRALPVRLRATTGLSATTGGSTQTTGPGKVLGLPAGYAQAFPGELRTLAGRGTGVLLAQQTAANLHAKPGDTVSDRTAGQRRPRVRVDGVVDLPAADSLFQQVGAPVGAQPQAPPDNVVLLPAATVRRAADRAARRSTHAGPRRALAPRCPAARAPPSPQVSGPRAQPRDAARRARASSATTSARRSTRRARTRSTPSCCSCSSACPARSSPALVTASIAVRRRATAAAATPRCCARAAPRPASSCASRSPRPRWPAALGVAVGLAARWLIGSAAFGTASFGAGTRRRVLWAGGAALAGLAVAAAAIALPAWRDARALTVAGQRRQRRPRDRAPWWARYGLDFVALARRRARLLAGVAQRLQPRARARGRPAGLGQLVRAAGARARLGRRRPARLPDRRPRRSSAGAAPLARALRPLAGELSPDRRGDDGPPAAAAGARRRAGRADRRLRRLHRRLQLDLPAAGRGRRAADQRRRRHRHRVARRAASGPRRAARLAQVAGVQQRRAAAAPLRLRRRRPPGPLRRAPAARSAPPASSRTRGSHGGSAARADGARSRSARTACSSSAETVQRLPAAPRRPAPPAAPGRPHQAVQRPSRSTTPAWPRSSRPRRRDSFLVANASYVAQGDRQRRRRHVPGPDRRHEPGAPSRSASAPRSARRAQVTDIADQRQVVGSNLTAVELSG